MQGLNKIDVDGRPLLVNSNKSSTGFELNPEHLEDVRYLSNKFDSVRTDFCDNLNFTVQNVDLRNFFCRKLGQFMKNTIDYIVTTIHATSKVP